VLRFKRIAKFIVLFPLIPHMCAFAILLFIFKFKFKNFI